MKKLCCTILLAAGIILPGGAGAAPITMTPDETLTIHFQSNAEPTDDFLEVLSGTTTVISPVGLATVRLYDGDAFLGSYTHALYSNPGTSMYDFFYGPFKSASSLVTVGTVVDFSTIADGSIDGRCEVTIDSGEFLLDTDRFVVRSGTSSGPGSVWSWHPGAITGISATPIPEPSVMFLVGTGLVGLLTPRVRRKLTA